MKGYCVDVRGFGVDKKRLVVDAVIRLTGLKFDQGCDVSKTTSSIVNVGLRGWALGWVACGDTLTNHQKPHLISFNDLMLEAGLGYVEDGIEGFKYKSNSEGKDKIADLEKDKEILIDNLYSNSLATLDLKSEIEGLHQQLRSKSEEIGQLNVKLHETEKELSKSRISGAVIFTCLVVVAVSNLFFGG